MLKRRERGAPGPIRTPAAFGTLNLSTSCRSACRVLAVEQRRRDTHARKLYVVTKPKRDRARHILLCDDNIDGWLLSGGAGA